MNLAAHKNRSSQIYFHVKILEQKYVHDNVSWIYVKQRKSIWIFIKYLLIGSDNTTIYLNRDFNEKPLWTFTIWAFAIFIIRFKF